MTDPFSLAEMLCARLCHDLAGPVGAAAAGAELLEDGAASDAETLELVAASAAGAAARLKFFREAFSPGDAGQTANALRDLAEGYLRTAVSAGTPGILLIWRAAVPKLSAPVCRLALNLILLGRDCLPRGGEIELSVSDGMEPAVVAHLSGEPSSLPDEARAVLMEGAAPVGPRGAQAAYLRLLAEGLGGLYVTYTERGLRIGTAR